MCWHPWQCQNADRVGAYEYTIWIGMQYYVFCNPKIRSRCCLITHCLATDSDRIRGVDRSNGLVRDNHQIHECPVVRGAHKFVILLILTKLTDPSEKQKTKKDSHSNLIRSFRN